MCLVDNGPFVGFNYLVNSAVSCFSVFLLTSFITFWFHYNILLAVAAVAAASMVPLPPRQDVVPLPHGVPAHVVRVSMRELLCL